MDKVIKLPSRQGFAETFASGTAPTQLNILDFTIPRDMGNISLSQSYVSIQTEILNDDTQPVNASTFLDVAGGEKINVPNSALVRNCYLRNEKDGLVESIRRQDTLKCGLFGMLGNAEDRKNDLNTLANYNDGRGAKIYTSYYLDRVVENTDPSGSVIDTQETSRNIPRDLKIPLSDIFGVCETDSYDTNARGATDIHLETNMKHLRAQIFGGSEDTTDGFDGATKQGAMGNQNGLAAGATITSVETSLAYGDYGFTFPFFVGEKVLFSATASAGASPVDVPVVIESIKFQEDNTQTPPSSVNNKMNITFSTAAYTNATGAPVNITGILIKAKVDQVLTIQVNKAELVLHKTEEPADEVIEFSTYTSQEDNGNGLQSFNKSYLVEAEANAFMVAMANNGAILPNRTTESYRYAIDNVEQTGNRDVGVGSPLQYDRLQRCLDNQLRVPFRNAQLKFYRNTETQANAYAVPVSMIAETAPITGSHKMVNLSVECTAGLQQVIVYSHMKKSI
jgi:hypothetical protein